ncbi:uncharacterized protein [Amphiura filiformis]|uniref:uncharacterized protein n=1 Tax=Amphiura filiformis TaxID=82378 RepID=UPI003B220FE8
MIDKQIVNMPLNELDYLYDQLRDKIHKETLPCTQEIAVRLAALQLVVDRANTSPTTASRSKLLHHDEPFNNNALTSSPLDLITTQDDSVFVDSTKRHGVNFDMETVILDDDPKVENRAIDNGSPWKSHGSPRLMRENRFDWGSSSESSYPNSPDHHSALMASKDVLRTSLPQGIANVRQVQKATKKCFRNYVDMLADVRDPKERAVKAKQLYVELCRHMPSYGSKIFQVKELSGNRIRKKVARILCISAKDICLLQPSTKAIFRSSPTHLLNNWCISSFKAGSGQLVLEFRGGARKWTLQPATFPELKAICASLSAVMQEVSANGGLLADVGPISRSTPASPSSGAHHSIMPPLTSLTTTTYQQEFEHCKQLLHFPEEVALILTDTEHRLFGTIPCGSYVRHVTNPGGGGTNQSQCSDEFGSKTVKDLILRFREVSDWVTETVTSADHDDKMMVLSRFVQIANSCWNIGNFNAVMEILEGLR